MNKLRRINTTWSLEAARSGFPIGRPVEVISGEICTAVEYREVAPERVEVWGSIEEARDA